jgi:hypothetical protein
MAVGGVARRANTLRNEVVGHRGDGTVEHLGETVVRVELLPGFRRGGAAREAVHEHELFADKQSTLQDLRLYAFKLLVALEQRLQAGGVLLP